MLDLFADFLRPLWPIAGEADKAVLAGATDLIDTLISAIR